MGQVPVIVGHSPIVLHRPQMLSQDLGKLRHTPPSWTTIEVS
jgi:hypothetical protein